MIMRDLHGELRTASLDGHVERVELLLVDGADINATNRNQDSALHLATYNGHTDMVRHLVNRGANIHTQNRNGQTPLQLACVRGHLDIVKYLTQLGVDIHTKTGYSEMSALHLGSKEGHPAVCQHLLDCGGDEELTDFIDNIAEFYAANYPTELVFKKWKQVPASKKQQLQQDHAKRKRQHLRNGVLIDAKPAQSTGLPRQTTDVTPSWRRPSPQHSALSQTPSATRPDSGVKNNNYDSDEDEVRDSSEEEAEPYDSDEVEETPVAKEREKSFAAASPVPQENLRLPVHDLSNVSSSVAEGSPKPAGEEDADNDKAAESSDWDSEDMDDKYADDDDDGGDASQGQGQGQGQGRERGRPRYPVGHYEPKKIPTYKPRVDKDREKKKYGYTRGGNWNRVKDHEFEWSDDFKKRQALKVWERLGGAGGGGAGAGGNRARPEGVKTERGGGEKPAGREPRSLSEERNKEPQPNNKNADRYNRAKSLERSRATAAWQADNTGAGNKQRVYKRGEAHWQRVQDHEFGWSEDFKKRQNMSVFDRLKAAGGAPKKEDSNNKPNNTNTNKEAAKPAPKRNASEIARPLRPAQEASNKGGDDKTARTNINAKPRVDTWRTPRKKPAAMAEVVVEKVVAEKEGEGGDKKE